MIFKRQSEHGYLFYEKDTEFSGNTRYRSKYYPTTEERDKAIEKYLSLSDDELKERARKRKEYLDILNGG